MCFQIREKPDGSNLVLCFNVAVARNDEAAGLGARQFAEAPRCNYYADRTFVHSSSKSESEEQLSARPIVIIAVHEYTENLYEVTYLLT